MSASTNTILATVIYQILRPLVRILLRNGIACGNFEEMARKAYVDEAFSQAEKQQGKASVSGVSAATGLSRKEVKRLRETEFTDSEATDKKYNRAIRVISGWLNDARFAYEEGNPRALPMDNSESSFANLVKQHSGDITVKAMLDLLQASGCIEVKDGTIHLVKNAYVPGNDPEGIIRILGNDTSELINTIDHNLTTEDKLKWFQRKVSNTRVNKDAIPAFKELSRNRSQKLLEELDSWLAQHEADRNDPDTRYVSLAIYYNEQDSEEDSQS